VFTRTVEVTPKSGKVRELASTINEKVLPILKKQAGFVDETLLVSDIEPNQILALSFWNSKEDAERYQREQYPAIHQMVRHLLEAEPVIRTFNVDSSTTHRIAAGKAAWQIELEHSIHPHRARLATRPLSTLRNKGERNMASKNVETRRAAHENWNKHDFAGVVTLVTGWTIT
jgi:heme-degrading monooxygenase HmoA